MRIIVQFLPILVLLSCYCEQDAERIEGPTAQRQSSKSSKSSIGSEVMESPQVKDSVLLLHNLIDVHALNKRIFVDLKYAGTENFLGRRMYDHIKKAYLQKDVADRLSKCQDYLTAIDTGLHLLIFDAVRPVSVQQKMWQALDTIPQAERRNYVSEPAYRSLHNYGAAVDLTICDSKGIPFDMGASFDEFKEIAYPSMEATFLANGQLTKAQIDNRKLLRRVMYSQYFQSIPTEWWHFNACSRKVAKRKYKCLENEP